MNIFVFMVKGDTNSVQKTHYQIEIKNGVLGT